MTEHKLDDVYGISRDVPSNYVARNNIDGELLTALARDRHIVIYGSSKQGKTCLRKWNLQPSDYQVVTCSNKWDIAQLHSAILKSAGYTIEQSVKIASSGVNKISAKASAKWKWGPVEPSMEVAGEAQRGTNQESTYEPLELDPSDVNDIIAALRDVGFNAYIVLEDFHYLPEECQKDFAVALKAFHESSEYCFLIVGVWLDENRLVQHNGDLTGRVITINADAWNRDQLNEVVVKGENLLNIEFSPNFKEKLLDDCFDSVWVVQEACHRVCELEGVYFSQPERRMIGSGQNVSSVLRGVVDVQSARYNSFISNFSLGFMTTSLEMYKWILGMVLVTEASGLERGLRYSDIRRFVDSYHPDAPVNPGNLTQALLSVASLQVGKMGIKPMIVDYGQSSRKLDVVDRSFLIWMQHQDRKSLLALAELPTSLADEWHQKLAQDAVQMELDDVREDGRQ